MNKKLLIFFIFLFLFSCTKEFNTIGTEILKDDSFETSVENIDVYASQKIISPFNTTNLPIYQIGEIRDNIFGVTTSSFITQLQLSQYNPSFGIISQEKENSGDPANITVIEENELIKSVYLDIPFFTNRNDRDGDGVIDAYDVDDNDVNSDSDGDGVSDAVERANGTDPLNPDTDGDGILDGQDEDTDNPNSGVTVYDVDSLLGNFNNAFKLKIQEMDYYLRQFDPTNNFETRQKYYNDNNILENFAGQVLFDGEVKIDKNELVIYREDDPETTDIDESEEVKERLSPRIRVPLNSEFFQSKLIDKEGSVDLTNIDNFNLYFKGIYVNAYDFLDPLMMILDFDSAEIVINYEYDKYNKNNTEQDLTDDTIDRELKDYKITFFGNKINLIKKDQFSPEIISNVNLSNNLSKIYLKGGEGLMAEIDLFKDSQGNDLLEEIKSMPWLINEANLTFYVDRETIDLNGGLIEPFRIYLYDLDSNLPIVDYYIDDSQGPRSSERKINHGGILEVDSDLRGIKYKIRISEHVKNIVRKDSANKKLGLVLSSSITNILSTELKGDSGLEYVPQSTVVNPLGTVLHGPEPHQSNYEKRLKLELFYSEIKN
ncbi:MAG: hypothetical protein CBD72_04460 [Flavobacteriaceae bacterium TMED212]|nr:MAG: hypothetical protein CBD72_04460 [Flavobacteriaceae bacterium TMED212]|tara:strand:+ start:395 stop:2200 length:1806 start_codon:yes stop_codon:yes gene_type:complete